MPQAPRRPDETARRVASVGRERGSRPGRVL